jgi:hypothetical protein
MASSYVNDLRLNEMATGDASGTWGTTTNTNLELIAEAFSYGTEAITTNADTHTTTIADGATDPGRSMYLKYTGTLDSACTITIGPNTLFQKYGLLKTALQVRKILLFLKALVQTSPFLLEILKLFIQTEQEQEQLFLMLLLVLA